MNFRPRSRYRDCIKSEWIISMSRKLLFSILLDARIQSNTCQEETSGTDEDVCGRAPREKRASESLEILKDHGDDPKHSDVDTVSARQSVAGDKTEIEIESIHRRVSQGGSSEVRST